MVAKAWEFGRMFLGVTVVALERMLEGSYITVWFVGLRIADEFVSTEF